MNSRKKQTQYEKMTETPISRLVLNLSVPAICSMLVTNIYNLVDTAFVGRLGTSASGAVGIVFGFMSIIQAFGFMFGQGGGSILSRALGGQDRERASVHASVAFFGSFGCGLIITLFGFLFLDRIVMFLGSTETIAPYARTYISFILVAAPFMCSSLTLNNLLRYEGKAYLGMIGLMSGAILNMVGDPILMFGLGMEIAGAGLSTALSQLASWGILVYMFLGGRTESKLSLKKAVCAGPDVAANIMATGFPSLLRQGLHSLTTVVLNSQCKAYGDAAVAAMSIVSRIIFFTFSLSLGVGQGFQPVSAFNYGARKYSRIREGYRVTSIIAESIIIVGVIILVTNAAFFVGLMRDDPEVIAIGERALVLQAVSNLLLPPCMVTEMLYQSTGHRAGATMLSALRSGILFIPTLLILSKMRGIAGIQEAQPVSIVLSFPIAIAFAVMFFKKLPAEDGAEITPRRS